MLILTLASRSLYLWRSSRFAHACNDEARDVIDRHEHNMLHSFLIFRVAQVDVPHIVRILADDWIPASDEFPFGATI